jgi:hypothetical protein
MRGASMMEAISNAIATVLAALAFLMFLIWLAVRPPRPD